MIPQKVIDLSKENLGVLCNFGPDQRPPPETEKEKFIARLELSFNTIYVDKTVMLFLKSLRRGEKALVLVQHFSKSYATAVLEVSQVYWDSCGYPRLDLMCPKGTPKCKSMPEPFNGTVEIWGAFIVAIARIKAETNLVVREDPGLDLFEKLVGEIVIC